MLLCKLDKLVHIGLDCFHSALHGRYGITLPLQSDTLSPDSPESLICQPCSTPAVHTCEVATEHEDFVGLEFSDVGDFCMAVYLLKCRNYLVRLQIPLKKKIPDRMAED